MSTREDRIRSFLHGELRNTHGVWQGRLSADKQREVFGRYIGAGLLTIEGMSCTILHTIAIPWDTLDAAPRDRKTPINPDKPGPKLGFRKAFPKREVYGPNVRVSERDATTPKPKRTKNGDRASATEPASPQAGVHDPTKALP